MVMAQCWECGTKKLCYEHLVCCTGTRFHTCPECRKAMEAKFGGTSTHSPSREPASWL